MNTSSPMIFWLRKITGYVPVSIYQNIYRRGVVSYVYHVISDESLPHIKHLYAYKTPKMFEHDLVYLKDNYTLISYEQLEAYQQGRIQFKQNAIFLSFDDGYRECFTVIRPLLLKNKVPCTFFITTDLIDNQKMGSSQKISLCIEKVRTSDEAWKQAVFSTLSLSSGHSIRTEQNFVKWVKSIQYSDHNLVDQVCRILELDTADYLKLHKPFMSNDELRILASDGFTIGAHTKSHTLLSKLSSKAIEEEIVQSCLILQEITNAKSIPFAFPFNGDGLKRILLEDIRRRNKEIGLFFDTDGIRKHKGSVLDRIWVDAPETSGQDQSNLPELLYFAYQEMILGLLRKFAYRAINVIPGRV